MDSRFAMIPPEVIADRDLTLEQLRVLLALYSFKAADSDVVFPSRQAIADMTGMHLSNISTATSALEGKGWLKKDGKGGHSKATRYTITIPNTVAESATVAARATVAEQATVTTRTIAEQATGPVADSARGKEHTKRTNKTYTNPTDFDPLQWLVDRGVTQDHARDWLAVRKAKKAANTETAFIRIYNQANRAGMSLDRVVQLMAEKSWQGFEAEWLKGLSTSSDGKQANPVAGEQRTCGGRREVFNDVAGWVPA